jgi:MFS family permease
MRIKINISVNRAIQLLLLYLFFAVTASSLFAPILSVFITKSIVGGSLRMVGFALALYAVTKSVIQVPLAKFLDRTKGELDDFYILIAGGLCATIYPLLLLSITRVEHLYAAEIFSGFGDACLMAAYYSLFSRHIDHGSEGFEWSLFSVGGMTLSSALGIAFGGVIAELYGFQTLFLLAAFINALAFFALVALYPFLDHGKVTSLPPIQPIPKSPITKH